MQLSDIVDVVGLTPVPSPIPSSDPPGEDDAGRIRCVCGSDEDDGFTIQCDSCLAWQHAVCVGIARNNVPEVFLCEECRPDDVDVEVSSGGTRKRRTGTSRETTPTLNEISENILAEEAKEEFAQIASEYEAARLQMPRLPKDLSLSSVNFELCRMVVFPSLADIRTSAKLLDVRELRVRSSGRRGGTLGAKLGVFAAEDIDPGAIVGEYVGHVQPYSILERKSPRVENVFQSFVLFTSTAPDLIVDARKFGNSLRYVRRSCRPNCEVKIVFSDGGESVHWCLFARNTIRENEELFLPFDYVDGNHFFRYECCCAYPELCLADDMPDFEEDTAKPTPSVSTVAPSTRRKIVDSRKMSREERKLQQYIEFIERMENAEKKSGRRSGPSGGASPPPSPPKRSRKASPSPTKQSLSPVRALSLPSSPTKLPLKKMLSRSFADRSRQSSLGSPVKSHTLSHVESPLKQSEDDFVDVTDSKSPPSMESRIEVDVVSLPASAPETPSKKRVSLSDYLSRRKSSPSDNPEIGERPYQSIVMKRDPAEMAKPGPADTVKVDPAYVTKFDPAYVTKFDPAYVTKFDPFTESRPMEPLESGKSFAEPQSFKSPKPFAFYTPPPLVGAPTPPRYYTPPPPLSERRLESEYDRWGRADREEGEWEESRRRRDSRRYPLFTDERLAGRERREEWDRDSRERERERDKEKEREWRDRNSLDERSRNPREERDRNSLDDRDRNPWDKRPKEERERDSRYQDRRT